MNLMPDRAYRLKVLPPYITKDIAWCFPVCLLQSVLVNLFLHASFPQKLLCNLLAPSVRIYPGCRVVMLNVNTAVYFPCEFSGAPCALKSSFISDKLPINSSPGQK